MNKKEYPTEDEVRLEIEGLIRVAGLTLSVGEADGNVFGVKMSVHHDSELEDMLVDWAHNGGIFYDPKQDNARGIVPKNPAPTPVPAKQLKECAQDGILGIIQECIVDLRTENNGWTTLSIAGVDVDVMQTNEVYDVWNKWQKNGGRCCKKHSNPMHIGPNQEVSVASATEIVVPRDTNPHLFLGQAFAITGRGETVRLTHREFSLCIEPRCTRNSVEDRILKAWGLTSDRHRAENVDIRDNSDRYLADDKEIIKPEEICNHSISHVLEDEIEKYPPGKIEQLPDLVNHPSHYTEFPMESKDMIQTLLKNFDWETYFGTSEPPLWAVAYVGAMLFNELKYRFRSGFKDKEKIQQDIEKSLFYYAERVATVKDVKGSNDA